MPRKAVCVNLEALEQRKDGEELRRPVDRAEFLKDAATSYAARGLAVFPLRGKLPAIAKSDGGSGYLDATIDPDLIRDWWTRYSGANIGIATRASRLLVLDVDPRHGGDKRLAVLEAEYGTLPHTPEVVSGGGGRHIYLQAPQSVHIQRKADALGEGLDLPNHVVAPPSIHPDTHRPYTWAACSRLEDVAIVEPPGWLISLLASVPKPQHTERTKQPPGWLGLVYEAIISRIEADGGQLKAHGDGGMTGRCPLHHDLNPSFSIHPIKGWKCFSGCGEGKLTSLAVKLGVSII